MDSADNASSPPEILGHENDDIICLGIFPKQEVVFAEPENTTENNIIPAKSIFPVLPPLIPLSPNSRKSLYTTPTKNRVCDSEECASTTSLALDVESDVAESIYESFDDSVSSTQQLADNISDGFGSIFPRNSDVTTHPQMLNTENCDTECTDEASAFATPENQDLTQDTAESSNSFVSNNQELVENGENGYATHQEKLRQKLQITFKNFCTLCSCEKLTTRRGHAAECPRMRKKRKVLKRKEDEKIELLELSDIQSDLSDFDSAECATQPDFSNQSAGLVKQQNKPSESAKRPKKKRKVTCLTLHARGKMYEVDSIVASSIQYGCEYRMVHWKGYEIKHDSWELRSQLAKQIPEMLFQYEKERKEKFQQLNSDMTACSNHLLPCSYSQEDKQSVKANRCHYKLHVMCDPVPELVNSSFIERLQGKTVNLVPKVARKDPSVHKIPETILRERSPELSQGEKYSAALHAVIPNADEPSATPTLKAKNMKKVIEALIKAKPRKKPGYVYFLIDPKEIEKYDIDNLPLESFLSSIIYIGKGTKSRSDQHLVDADRFDSPNKNRKEPKVNRLLEIWENDGEIIPFHLFDYADDDVAFLLEAAMIQAVGLRNLTNKMRGHLSRFQSLEIDPKPSMDEIAEFGSLLLLDAHLLFKKTAFLFPPVPRSKVRFREKQRLEEESQQDSLQQAIQDIQSSLTDNQL